MADKNLTEFRLTIGDSVIGLTSSVNGFAEFLMDYFGVKNSSQAADITLNIKPVFHNKKLDIPNSMFNTKTVKGNKFEISNNLVKGKINPDTGDGILQVKYGLLSGALLRVFEQVLYQAFYSACRKNNSNSILIHSSGVINNNKGFLFVGASGSGKTTVARLSKDLQVLNDEICLLDFSEDKIIVRGTPFNGFFKEKQNGSAPLKAILFPEPSKAHKITAIKRSQAVKTLAREIVPPIALNESLDSNTFVKMIDYADKIYHTIKVNKLEFLPDKGFWNEIDKGES